MTEPEMIRVFVNGTGISLEPGKSVLDAVRAVDAGEANDIVAGTRAVTDSRGLPIALDAPLSGGAVLRVVSARALRSAEENG